jgi:hypothetical protein
VRYIPKPDNKPCSITDSVKRFPTEEATEGNATSPPQNPPTNLTVVTVEGCPSFVILDWEKPLNDTVTGKIIVLVLITPVWINVCLWDWAPGSNCDTWSISEEKQVLAEFYYPYGTLSKCHGMGKIIFVFVMGSLLT